MPACRLHRQLAASTTTSPGMDTINRAPNDNAATSCAETEAARRRRLAWEAEMTAEADADIAAARLVDSGRAQAWTGGILTDQELPVPYSGR